ncbi:hypothetical protein [Levilactobacillus yonginensis]|uniref:hypothetical protein n=1 Tax=Levilactobacillus yonginensis TaxID=1054041 RepID=UPI00345C796C
MRVKGLRVVIMMAAVFIAGVLGTAQAQAKSKPIIDTSDSARLTTTTAQLGYHFAGLKVSKQGQVGLILTQKRSNWHFTYVVGRSKGVKWLVVDFTIKHGKKQVYHKATPWTAADYGDMVTPKTTAQGTVGVLADSSQYNYYGHADWQTLMDSRLEAAGNTALVTRKLLRQQPLHKRLQRAQKKGQVLYVLPNDTAKAYVSAKWALATLAKHRRDSKASMRLYLQAKRQFDKSLASVK